MKNFFKATMCAVALAATTAMAGSFPFPQNMKSPYGYTIPFAKPQVIKDHFKLWKQAWYQDKGNEAWVLAPEGTCSTVSEAIAYGMLITVYMDEQSMFDKLYATWKNNGGNGAGMNWRVGCDGGSGSASDADFDAALALVMASKQWGGSYLNDAKTLINWIGSNDISGNKIMPGNQWGDYFNPSYATTANFALFQKVAGGSWNNVISQAYTDLNACQNSTSGLVPDWCDWNSHKPVKNSKAAVAQDEDPGFFDDAARTPWRMAWAYYWFGDTKAQAFNKKINDWMIPTARTASGINSGYFPSGQAVTSEKRNFVSSTFSGGMGMAASSFDDASSKDFMESVYKTLANLESCTSANGCGEGSNPGEKYYPSTLNILYLLLITGNMPNFYDMTGFTQFIPDTSLASGISTAEGVQQASKDSTVGLSGFWNWGAYHDKLGIGTVMSPDSGTSPLYKTGCEITAEATMEIGPEPKWTQEAADAGTLKYPSAGIAMSFLANDKKGVNLQALGVKYLRVNSKTKGPIRLAILNEKTVEAGGEPGTYVDGTGDYTTVTYDLTPDQFGFKGDGKNEFTILDWVKTSTAPTGEEILTAVKGLKWEVKDAKGGFGSVSIKSIEFLDGSKQVIDPVKITGIQIPELQCGSNPTSSGSINPGTSSSGNGTIGFFAAPAVDYSKVIVAGNQVQVLGATAGTAYAVFSMQGRVIASGRISSATENIVVPNKGTFLVRVGNSIHSVTVK